MFSTRKRFCWMSPTDFLADAHHRGEIHHTHYSVTHRFITVPERVMPFKLSVYSSLDKPLCEFSLETLQGCTQANTHTHTHTDTHTHVQALTHTGGFLSASRSPALD